MTEKERNSSDARSDDVIKSEEEDVLAWTVHPVRRKPLLSVGISLLIPTIGLGVYYSTDSSAFAGLAMVILFASLAKFYFPTSYELTSSRIIIKSTTQTLSKEWRQYRSCYPDKKGVFLSPFEEKTRLENFRGIYLMCEGNIDEVADFARFRIGRGADDNAKRKEISG